MRKLKQSAERKRRNLWIFILAGVVMLLAIPAFVFWPAPQTLTVQVTRGDIVHSVVALGRVEGEKMVEISANLNLRIEAVSMKEGDKVTAGQVLATLNSKTLDAARDEAVHALEAANAKLAETKRGARQEQVDFAGAQVKESEANLEIAQAKLKETEKGGRAEEQLRAKARVDSAQTDVEFWQKEVARNEDLLQKNVISERELDSVKQRLESAKAALQDAKSIHEMTQKASEEQVAIARAGVKAAESKHEQAQARLAEIHNGATKEELDMIQADVNRAESMLKRIDRELEQTRLTAPADGEVARVYREAGEMPNTPVMLLACGKRVIRAEVNETDIFKIHDGQECLITSDAFPASTFHGKITSVSQTMGRKSFTSEHPRDKVDLKILEVKVEIDSKEPLPIFVPVEVKIQETIRKDVLRIPSSAIRNSGGRTFVRTKTGDVEISTGSRDDWYVEVTSGLKEGDTLFTNR